MHSTKNLSKSFAIGLVLFSLLVPTASALTFLDRSEDLFEDASSPYTDLEVPTMPSSGPTEEYYADLGTLLLSEALFNGMSPLQGYEASNGTRYYSPDQSLNRAEAAKFFAAFNVGFASSIDSRYNNGCFTDIGSDDWYQMYACLLKEAGVISGYSDGTYKGSNTLNNAEIMKFLVKGYGLDEYTGTDVTESNYSTWYEGYQNVLEELQIIPNNLNPNGNPSRSDMAGYIMRAYTVDTLATGEPFDSYQLMLLLEEELGMAGVDPLQGLIYAPNEDLYFETLTVDIANEEAVIRNNGSEEIDLSGYYVRLWNKQGQYDFMPSEVEYVFEDTTVAAGDSVAINSIEGDHVLEGGDRYGDGGLIDKIYGTYAYVLYDEHSQIVDIVGFQIP